MSQPREEREKRTDQEPGCGWTNVQMQICVGKRNHTKVNGKAPNGTLAFDVNEAFFFFLGGVGGHNIDPTDTESNLITSKKKKAFIYTREK